MPGALDGPGQLPLVGGADTGVTRVNDFSLAGNKIAQRLNVFIINISGVLRAKKTLSFFVSHKKIKMADPRL